MKRYLVLFAVIAFAIGVIGCTPTEEAKPADPTVKTGEANQAKPGAPAPSAAVPTPVGGDIEAGTKMKSDK
jgi:hypothetical protein